MGFSPHQSLAPTTGAPTAGRGSVARRNSRARSASARGRACRSARRPGSMACCPSVPRVAARPRQRMRAPSSRRARIAAPCPRGRCRERSSADRLLECALLAELARMRGRRGGRGEHTLQPVQARAQRFAVFAPHRQRLGGTVRSMPATAAPGATASAAPRRAGATLCFRAERAQARAPNSRVSHRKAMPAPMRAAARYSNTFTVLPIGRQARRHSQDLTGRSQRRLKPAYYLGPPTLIAHRARISFARPLAGR